MSERCPRCATILKEKEEFCSQCGEYLPGRIPSVADQSGLTANAFTEPLLLGGPSSTSNSPTGDQQQLSAEQRKILGRLDCLDEKIEHRWRVVLIVFAFVGGFILFQLIMDLACLLFLVVFSGFGT